MAYKRIMQIMDPKVQGNLRRNDITQDLDVTLYSRGWKTRVAEAKVDGSVCATRQGRVQLDLKSKGKIFAPGTFIDVVEDGNVATHKEAISSLCLESPEGIVKFDWPLYLCKRTIDTSGSEDPVKINTQQKQIFRVEDEPQVSHQQNYDADADESDNEVINNFGHNHSDSSDGGNDVQAQLPRSTRRRLRHFKKEKVKNDIVHIFFRFEKALSKEHGAFVDFIRALRDAMFVMDQRDLDLCLQVLREKHGMSEKDIQKKMMNGFGWFLR